MNLEEQKLHELLEAFYIDRKAQNFTPGTIRFYKFKLKLFFDYCDSYRPSITKISQITPYFLREFFLKMGENHNPGGVHGIYRCVKTFLLWYESEFEPENWKNPIRKVKPPKLSQEPLNPISLEDINELLNVSGLRDKAIFLVLLDTGVRATELIRMNLKDINLLTGEILIRQGKGRKPRIVYLGSKSRKAVRKYLKQRKDSNPSLWINDDSNRLAYIGLRSMLLRRAKQANIPIPTLHSFRRAFALSMLRSGVDLVTLANLMGHASLSVLQRYLKQTNEDTRLAHNQFSPVDNRLFG